MSFLTGRLAATEGAYFLQESKQAVDRLVQKKNKNLPPSSASPSSSQAEDEVQADVLHEILRHSLPPKILKPSSESSLSRTSKWDLHRDPNQIYPLTADALNPLRAYVSLPQVTFGAKRWQLPEAENSVVASKANDLRSDRYTTNTSQSKSDKLNEAAEIGRSYVIATTTVYAGSAVAFGLMVSQTREEIRTKGREFLEPKVDVVRVQLIPLQIWVRNVSKKWHYETEETKDNSLVKELSKRLGAK